MIPSLVVRVTGDFDGSIQAAPTANDETAKAQPARSTKSSAPGNLGPTPWGHAAVASAASLGRPARGLQVANVVGRWIPPSLDAAAGADLMTQAASGPPDGMKPGASVTGATLALDRADRPGPVLRSCSTS